jgi:hypothetical protein
MSVGLPVELDFSQAMSMPESRSYEYRIQPSNSSTFTSAGAVAQISLPQINNAFWETPTMYLTGRMTVTCAGTKNTDVCYLPACGAYGFFSQQVWRTNAGQTLENIQQLGPLANFLMSVGIDGSQRNAYANMLCTANDEANYYNNLGLKFFTNSPGAGNVIDFAIPLLGIMNSSKYLPAYGTELVLELTVAPSTSWAIPGTATAAVTGFTLSNLELSCSVLEVGQAGMSMINSQYGSNINIKTQSYAFGASSIPASSSGTVDIPFQVRALSMKQLFVVCSPTNVAEGVGYGSVNPNASAISFLVNGVQYPQTAVRANRPAETFTQLQKAFGSLYSSDKSTQIALQGYRTASTAYVSDVFSAYNSTRLTANYNSNSNRWLFALDLESLANHKELMYNGVNTQTGTNVLRIEIATALAAHAHSILMFSCHDVILNFDLQNGLVSAIY